MPVLRTILPLLLILAVSMWVPEVVRGQDTLAGGPPPKSESHALKLSRHGDGRAVIVR